MLHNFMNHDIQLDILSLWETPNKQALANNVLRSEIWEQGHCWKRQKWKETRKIATLKIH